MTRERVLATIPHRPPFLWVDEIVESTPDRIRTSKRVDPDEAFFQGHYPDFPVTPGVLVVESMLQTGALLLAERCKDKLAEGLIPVVTRIQDTRFKAMVRPGDTLDIEVEIDEIVSTAFYLKGKATIRGGKLAARSRFTVALVPKGG